MIFKEVKEHITEVNDNTQKFINSSISYYKLKGFKLLMLSVTSLTKLVVTGFILVIALIFLSLAASIGIGQLIHNPFLGYLIIGLFYLGVALLFYWKRKYVEQKIISKFSADFFDEESEDFIK